MRRRAGRADRSDAGDDQRPGDRLVPARDRDRLLRPAHVRQRSTCRAGAEVPAVGDRVSVRVELQVPFLSGLLGGQDTATAAGDAVGQVER